MNPLREGLRVLGRSRARSALLALLLLAAGVLVTLAVLVAANSRLTGSVWLQRLPVDVLLSETGEALDEAAWRARVARLPNLGWGRLLSREQAAAEFAQAFGRPLEDLIGENPFPAVLELRLRPDAAPEDLALDLSTLASWPEVSEAAFDAELMLRLAARLRLVGRVLAGGAAVLLLAALLLVGRGLASQLSAWSPEMRLLAVCGASPGQLRAPLLVAAALLGVVPLLAVPPMLAAAGFAAGLLQLPLRVPLALWLLPLWGALILLLLAWRPLNRRVLQSYSE
jgi:cell division transport system permease protein